MTTWVLNDKTAETSIVEILNSANGSDIEIRAESGEVLARILVNPNPPTAEELAAIEEAEAEIDQIQRRDASDRTTDITTEKLLARVAARAGS